MKILITGGLGTIGSCLAGQLFRQGHQIHIFDNQEIGVLQNLLIYLSEDEVAEIKITKKDILDREQLAMAINSSDMVYHLAATLGTLNVVAQPTRMMRVNSLGTHHVVDLCETGDVPLVLMSTSMVYGGNPKETVCEDDELFVGGDLNIGLWWYAISKMADEAYANAHMLENKKSKILIIRPFNVIAPVQTSSAGFVFPRFFQAAISGEPLLVYGSGSQRRTFTWAEDFVACLIALVERDCWRRTINIGGTESISILDLAKQIRVAVGSDSEIRLQEPQELFNGQFAEIQQRTPNVDRLEELIGFVPETSISSMIDKFHKFYSKTYQPPKNVSRY